MEKITLIILSSLYSQHTLEDTYGLYGIKVIKITYLQKKNYVIIAPDK